MLGMNPSKQFVLDVVDECYRSLKQFPLFRSPHEGCAVIREEFEELWDAVKHNQPNVYDELVQTAAMCLKFAESVQLWEEATDG